MTVVRVPVVGATGSDIAAAPFPFAFVALTVNRYAVLFARPETVQDVAPLVVHTWSPDAVTLYPVIVLPPLSAGADQDTAAEALPATAVTAVGTPGVPSAGQTTAAAACRSVARAVADPPSQFHPQHFTLPPESRAQVRRPPAAIAAAPLMPVTAAGA